MRTKGERSVASCHPVDRARLSVGPLVLSGSLLYVWACASWTHKAYWQGAWSPIQQHALINVPFLVRQLFLFVMVGTVLFSLGCAAACIEAANSRSMAEWREAQEARVSLRNGKDKPNQQGGQQLASLRLFPSEVADQKQIFEFSGCVIQFAGLQFFLLGSVMGFLAVHFDVPHTLELWLVDVALLLGCTCFVVGACFLVHSESVCSWVACCPRIGREELVSLRSWITLLNWLGSMMFLAGGFQIFVSDKLSIIGNQVMAAFTWLLGCVLFTLQGLLICISSMNPSCT